MLDPDGSHGEPGVHGFVFASEHGMAMGFGAPSVRLADELRDLADRHGMVQEPLELHLPISCANEWLALDGVTSLGLHRVQVLDENAVDGKTIEGGLVGQGVRHSVAHETVVLESKSDPLLETLPRALRAEFAAMRPWPMVVASLAGECIASIASAFVETENYFDVSIDTVPDFRRAGFGFACARALIEQQRLRGKEPVWMVREKNRASLALSEQLGFRDIGRVQSLLF
ncbi:FR47-like protein [Planctomycetes bacterium Poly30]|uniref:FR47-like protein n=1 Tax=Saltatorellus ferox TaxID=2528018 RepID=A0A518F0D7_9BACT|nr:FR47-like protein [Planctomycetes bacterium Poly30]